MIFFLDSSWRIVEDKINLARELIKCFISSSLREENILNLSQEKRSLNMSMSNCFNCYMVDSNNNRTSLEIILFATWTSQLSLFDMENSQCLGQISGFLTKLDFPFLSGTWDLFLHSDSIVTFPRHLWNGNKQILHWLLSIRVTCFLKSFLIV